MWTRLVLLALQSLMERVPSFLQVCLGMAVNFTLEPVVASVPDLPVSRSKLCYPLVIWHN